MEDMVFIRNLVGEKKKKKEAVQHRGRYIFFQAQCFMSKKWKTNFFI